MSSKFGKIQTKKTGHAKGRKHSSYTKSAKKNRQFQTRRSNLQNKTIQRHAFAFEWTTAATISWDDLPEFNEKELVITDDTSSHASIGHHTDSCPCEEDDHHFCHDCRVCSEECCGLTISSYISYDEDGSQTDTERESTVSWNPNVTIHHSAHHSVELLEVDYHDYRRPQGGKVCRAGYAPVLRGEHRDHVHELRPDLQRAPHDLETINLEIDMEEDRKLFNQFLETVEFW